MSRIDRHVKDLALAEPSPRPDLRAYSLRDGRRRLAEGRPVSLATAEGHPSAVIDMGFANQALCAQRLVAQRGRPEYSVHEVPPEIDRELARLKLAATGVRIDALSEAPRGYFGSWRERT